ADLRVDALAHRITLGALLRTLAGQVGLADEAGDALGQLQLDAALVDLGHRSGDDRALLEAVARALEGIGLELLDAEGDALLLDVDVEQLDLDVLALLVVLHGLLARALPIEVGQVDHAVDLAGQPDEQAELGDVLDLAF